MSPAYSKPTHPHLLHCCLPRQCSFSLPNDVEAEGITASVKNGILTVTVPKAAKAEAQPKEIPIAG